MFFSRFIEIYVFVGAFPSFNLANLTRLEIKAKVDSGEIIVGARVIIQVGTPLGTVLIGGDQLRTARRKRRSVDDTGGIMKSSTFFVPFFAFSFAFFSK